MHLRLEARAGTHQRKTSEVLHHPVRTLLQKRRRLLRPRGPNERIPRRLGQHFDSAELRQRFPAKRL
uniref:HTH_38 domain-containing protein n=1 Tax=Mesocestoides corti TaxID=53468 RepID=A0A5K3FBH0_MESCO